MTTRQVNNKYQYYFFPLMAYEDKTTRTLRSRSILVSSPTAAFLRWQRKHDQTVLGRLTLVEKGHECVEQS